MNTFTVNPNTNRNNLIIEGINDFLFLFEKIFNGKNEEDFKRSYENHNLRYNEFKNRSNSTRYLKDFIKNGTITPFRLEVSRIQLTAAIQIIAEVIAGRDFSCEFDKYTINDIRALQDALGKLWTASDYNNKTTAVIRFN